MTGGGPWRGSALTKWGDLFVVVEPYVNVREQPFLFAGFQSFGAESLCLEGEAAYSIALESSVAAFTLWDRPCDLHHIFEFSFLPEGWILYFHVLDIGDCN
ncbi:hypothetical protein KC19_12G100700 [Ceratodon purpureus]|uniref:Uncharacterized protein n=1 Tax=Ceratodon purpureus TaxID=3225 RepID=A0A8T0G6V1_CERPU|nr:hypothetical protein KC19_12G100700 [Ceratodon purpureus]